MINRRHVYSSVGRAGAAGVDHCGGIDAGCLRGVPSGFSVGGDDPWPNTANVLLGAIFLFVAAALWLALLFVAYTVGRHTKVNSH